METLYIVMPAYNEEDNIFEVVSGWYSILDGKSENSRLVIADSGSTDNTHKILLDLMNKYPKLEVLSNTDKNHGPKVIALYKYAIQNKADWIFQTDSDGQTSPEEFNSFWIKRGQHDAIIGWRPVRGDGKIRALVEKTVCLILKIYFHVSIPDANAPFRLMKSEIINKYINRFPDDYNIPNIMMTTYFVYYNERIIFEKISFRQRLKGNNSINIFKILKIGINALGDFREFKSEM